MSADARTELEQLAALLASGALPDTETEAARWRLEGAGEDVREDLASMEQVAGALGLEARAVDPPDGLRARLLDRVAKEKQPGRPGLVLNEDGVKVLRSSHAAWKPIGEGVASRVLTIDEKTGFKTHMIRIDPGSFVPEHRHGGAEDVLVLSGDLEVHGQRMGPGDYCFAESGSTHKKTFSRKGAMLLVRTSIHNEYSD